MGYHPEILLGEKDEDDVDEEDLDDDVVIEAVVVEVVEEAKITGKNG